MDNEIIQTTITETGRPSRSSGFFTFTIILVLVTQLLRLVATKFNWNLFLNDKFAFSLNVPVVIIYLLYFGVLGTMAYYLLKHRDGFNLFFKSGFILILSGGISNLLERLLQGYVVDYIFLLNGVLNLADFYIFLGVILVVFSSTKKKSVKV